MRGDGEGFLYPKVDVTRCIGCGLCEKVCPELASPALVESQSSFAAYNMDDTVREKSSSGGVFTLLSEKMISAGGVVFGARLDSSWQVYLSHIDDDEKLFLFRGSKYVQARVGDAYLEAERLLKSGTPVLFTGTPCQISGLLHFLRKPYELLVTMEIACHGVPSPKVWEEHLKELQLKQFKKSHVKNIFFRYKYNGWKGYRLLYRLDDGTDYSVNRGEDCYLRGFVSSLYNRPSCQHCIFKDGASGADIMVGDLWGSEHIAPDMEDGKGLSLMCVSTVKGKDFVPWEKLKYKKIKIEDAALYNEGLLAENAPHRNRGAFFALLPQAVETHRVDNLIKKMLKPTLSERMRALPGMLRGWAWQVKHRIFDK